MDVAVWLRELGLERYARAFIDNDIDATVLRGLTPGDLIALGVSSVGHRRKLLEALALLERPPAAAQPAAERRQLTVLYCDMVGSTALSSRLDPEDLRDVIRAYHGTCTQVLARHEGYVANLIGDAMVAYFGWPRAHENDAERAAHAGLEMAAAVATLRTPGGGALAARVGIATGRVVVGDLIREGPAKEFSAVGETVNVASRLQELAKPGQVVVAGSTQRLLVASFTFLPLGRHTLAGVPQPEEVYAITGEQVIESRFEARSGPRIPPMVGRNGELDFLQERWKRARVGDGHGVLLIGEAGIGKSRIARALLDTLAAEPHVRVRYQCSAHHIDSALWPIINQVRHAARLRAEEPLEIKLDKLEALLGGVGGKVPRGAALIAAMVGIDGTSRYGPQVPDARAQRANTLAALVDHVLWLSEKTPLMILVEDVHWVDPTTLEFIARLLERIATARVLVLLTSRPDGRPEVPATQPVLTQFTLKPLARSEVEAIVMRLCGDRVARNTVESIVSRTDGIPLYAEELTKAVLENVEVGVPGSLHDSLMARLDRHPEAKQVAQIAGCIGREFDPELLMAVAERPSAEVDRAVADLVAAELLFRRGMPPRILYRFKHALIQDAARESMLHEQRQRVHARILAVLEIDPEGNPPDLLAHHAACAHLDMKAIGYWQRAGEAALRKSASAEAAAYFGNAVELMQGQAGASDRADREFVLQVRLGQAHASGQGTCASPAMTAFYRARALLPNVHDTALRATMYYGICSAHYTRGELGIALEMGQEFMRAVESDPDDAGRLRAHNEIGRALLLLGELGGARRHLEMALSLYDPAQHVTHAEFGASEPGGVACAYLAHVMFLLGVPSVARTMLDRARQIEATMSNTSAKAYLNFHCMVPALVIGDISIVGHHARRLEALALEHRLKLRHSYATLCLAFVALESDRPADALERYQQGLTQAKEGGAGALLPFFASGLARALAALDRTEESRTVIQQAICDTDRTGECWCDAELWRIRGELLLRGAPYEPDEAERSFERALALARMRGARLWEARAARSLARLWTKQARGEQARRLLEALEGIVEEGSEGAVAMDAKPERDGE